MVIVYLFDSFDRPNYILKFFSDFAIMSDAQSKVEEAEKETFAFQVGNYVVT